MASSSSEFIEAATALEFEINNYLYELGTDQNRRHQTINQKLKKRRVRKWKTKGYRDELVQEVQAKINERKLPWVDSSGRLRDGEFRQKIHERWYYQDPILGRWLETRPGDDLRRFATHTERCEDYRDGFKERLNEAQQSLVRELETIEQV
ncbi:hypothetical protein K491DRAFT_722249 [Lophiostoma macrostomum CBS 122681]|uniref:Uncharacterized protein n=1 Tax=Lophiostoma macrostomum CBS 122681 TaxID=1314788 RepID=A0A6A6SMS0_9PLEO|nr:hypothetical protein K491DRAFT_722249 [Lophiostoma macrostomum CBS 122681]